MPMASKRKSWALTGTGPLVPGPAGVAEVADQLLLLGVDADEGQTLGDEGSPLLGDVGELSVTIGVFGAGEPFVVDPQLEVELLEQLGDGVGTDFDVQLVQFVGDLL